jgi:glycosyltransferase involved in cell wall biosynthesis
MVQTKSNVDDKVVILNNRPSNGGIGQYSLNIYENMINLAAQNLLIEYNTFREHRFIPPFSALDFFNYRKKIHQLKNSYKIFHAASPGILSHMIKNFKNIRIVTVHDVYLKEQRNSIISNILERFLDETPNMNAIIFVSKFTAERYKEVYNWHGKSTIIHYGIDHLKFAYRDKYMARFALGLPQEKKIIIYVGDTLQRKNINTLFKVYSKISNLFGSKVMFLFIGGDSNIIQSLSKRYEIHNLIHKSDVPYEVIPSYFNSADLMIYPSSYEGFGLPALEAMASGIPLISSNSSSLSEVVNYGGILVNPFDIDAYFDYSVLILEDKNEQENLAKRAVKRSKDFSWRNAAIDTLNFYGTLLD